MSGKNALPGKRGNFFELDPNELTLVVDPSHKLFDERVFLDLEEEKILAAMEHGVGGVIEVVKEDDRLLVVSGRQRTKYLREANKRLAEQGLPPKTLRAVLLRSSEGPRKAPSTIDMTGAMIRENALRTDLTPLQKGSLASRLIDLLKQEGRTDQEALEDASKQFGVTVQRIKDWTKVDSFAPEVKQAIEDRKISADSALKVFRNVPAEEQGKKLRVEMARMTPKVATEPKRTKPRVRNMNKSIAKFMADDPGGSLPEAAMLALQFAFGRATVAECCREIRGFKKSYERAKRELAKE